MKSISYRISKNRFFSETCKLRKNGLSNSTNQRNHTGHGSDCRRDAKRHVVKIINAMANTLIKKCIN